MDIKTLLYTGGVGLIIALVQVAKRWVTDDKLYPVLAMLFGVLINLTIGCWAGQDILTSFFSGMVAGLLACGIYSVGGTGGTTPRA